MADYTPARLRIGGEITRAQYRAIQALTDDDAEVFFGSLYEIWHERARGGAFTELEAYLVEQGIAFDRYSAPALAYDGCLVQYRPGMSEPVAFRASGDNRERLVPVTAIQSALTGCKRKGLAMKELMEQLWALCGPVISPLTKFRVRLA